MLAVWATAGFVGGRGSLRAAGRTPRAGAGAPAASGSRSWSRRRGGRAQRWGPPRESWPGRRRAAPRTAPAAPRSAAHVRVMPGPHRDSLSNAFEGGSGNPAYRDSRCQPAWSRWGTLGAILPAFCPTALHRAAQPRITLNAQVTWILADQRERDCGEPSRTEPNESHPAENRKVGGSIPSLPTGHIDTVEDRVASGPGLGRPPLRPTQAEGNAPRRRCHPREAAWQTIRT
jgi:hypothetical protein